MSVVTSIPTSSEMMSRILGGGDVVHESTPDKKIARIKNAFIIDFIRPFPLPHKNIPSERLRCKEILVNHLLGLRDNGEKGAKFEDIRAATVYF